MTTKQSEELFLPTDTKKTLTNTVMSSQFLLAALHCTII